MRDGDCPLLTRRRLLGGLAAGLFIPAAPRILRAQGLGLGMGLDNSRRGAASGGGGGYTAQGVHFDGATSLMNNALSSSDNGTMAFSVWINNDPAAVYSNCFYVDPAGEEDTFYTVGGTAAAGYWGVGNSVDYAYSSEFSPNSGNWIHVIGSADARSAGAPTLIAYRTDVAVGQPITNHGLGAASNIDFNGLPLLIGNDPFNEFLLGDMADLWIAPGVSLLVAGDIPLATRRKFIDGSGKPVYLGANGELPTGTAPAVFLSAASGGPASTFASNKGTGGAFTTTGALTLSATSP